MGEDGTEDGDPAWREALARLATRHDVIAVRVVDPLEEELPPAGIVRLARIQGAGVREVDTRSEVVREAWNTWAEGRREGLARALQKARAEWVDVRTDGDPTAPLVAFFKRRNSRAGSMRK